jgi:hypothetical protein
MVLMSSARIMQWPVRRLFLSMTVTYQEYLMVWNYMNLPTMSGYLTRCLCGICFTNASWIIYLLTGVLPPSSGQACIDVFFGKSIKKVVWCWKIAVLYFFWYSTNNLSFETCQMCYMLNSHLFWGLWSIQIWDAHGYFIHIGKMQQQQAVHQLFFILISTYLLDL